MGDGSCSPGQTCSCQNKAQYKVFSVYSTEPLWCGWKFPNSVLCTGIRFAAFQSLEMAHCYCLCHYLNAKHCFKLNMFRALFSPVSL